MTTNLYAYFMNFCLKIFFCVALTKGLFSNGLFGQDYVERSVQNWNTYMRGDLESLKEDALETIRRGLEEKNEYAIAVGKRSLGTYLSRVGHTEKSFRYLEDAATWFSKEGDKQLEAETLNELGNAYQLSGRLLQAKKAYLYSIKAGKGSSDPTAAFLAEINLAQAYLEMKDTNAASALVHHYKRRSAFFQKWEAVANAYAVLASIAQGQGNNDLSVEFFEKSAYFGLRSNAPLIRGQALNNLAIVRFADGDNGNAERLFLEAWRLRMKSGLATSISESMFNLALFYEEIGANQNAIKWYKKQLDFTQEKQLIDEFREASMSYSDLLSSEGRWEEANEVLKELAVKQADIMKSKAQLSYDEYHQLDGLNSYMDELQREQHVPKNSSIVQIGWWVVGLIVIGYFLFKYIFRHKTDQQFN
jgi:tetratricopeptide (TPR) repeat protein